MNDEDLTPTAFEQIIYWGLILMYVVLSIGTVCGIAGYVWAKYF